jgi:hypothetical protein
LGLEGPALEAPEARRPLEALDVEAELAGPRVEAHGQKVD